MRRFFEACAAACRAFRDALQTEDEQEREYQRICYETLGRLPTTPTVRAGLPPKFRETL